MDEIKDLLAKLEEGPDDNPAAQLKPSIRFDWNKLQSIDTEKPGAHPAVYDSWAVTLTSGRVIRLEAFHQFEIYAGLLAGFPMFPERYALDAIRRARDFEQGGWPLLMLEPVLLSGHRENARCEEMRTWKALSPVATVALFRSSPTARGNDEVFSSLVVLWFQNQFGLPAEPGILDMLKNLDWDREARDWTP